MYKLFVTRKANGLVAALLIGPWRIPGHGHLWLFVYVGGTCGSSTQNDKNVRCVPLSDFRGDVSVHLKTLHVWDASLKTEAQLLVAGAGIV